MGTSIVQKMLQRLFPKSELRALFLGLDASGRTTTLYMMKLGELVTTIPTIGFNVETLEWRGSSITAWDVGGCDKIRPLWRHYFENMQMLLFFVDSNDRERMPEVKEEIHRLAQEPSLLTLPMLVVANKQDLPGARSAAEVEEFLDLRQLGTSRTWSCLPLTAISGDGLSDILDWVVEVAGRMPKDEKSELPTSNTASQQDREMEELFQKWLEHEDEDDDVFLASLRDYSLSTWDHRTHVRIAWLLLGREGRRRGMELIFEGIRNFIANSPRTQRARGTTFHETMTYFWAHMVHYAMAVTNNPDGSFKTFLLLNPQFVNGGMFLHYFSAKLMLRTPEARTSVVLPDKRPLPSLITDVNAIKSRVAARKPPADVAPGSDVASDEDFLCKFEAGSFSSWSHESLIRVMFIVLSRDGRRAGAETLLSHLRRMEGSSFHFTIAWFWIHIVDISIAMGGKKPATGPPRLPTAGEPRKSSTGPSPRRHEESATAAGAPPEPSSVTAEEPGSSSLASSVADVAKPADVADSKWAVGQGEAANQKQGSSVSPSAGSRTKEEFFEFRRSGSPGGQQLDAAAKDPRLYLKYYSEKSLFSEQAKLSFVLPDKLPFPSVIGACQSKEGHQRSWFFR